MQKKNMAFISLILIFMTSILLSCNSVRVPKQKTIPTNATQNEDNQQNTPGIVNEVVQRATPTKAMIAKSPTQEQQLVFPNEEKYWILINGVLSNNPGYINSDGSRNSDIGIMGIDGKNFTKLTNTPGERELSPIWSPDGKKVAYIVSDMYGSGKYIVVMKSDGSQKNTIAIGSYYLIRWSPDGKKILGVILDPSWKLDVINVDGSNIKTVVEEKDPRTTAIIGVSPTKKGIAWSPDSKKIAYIFYPEGWSKTEYEQQTQIHVVDIENSEDNVFAKARPNSYFKTVSWMRPSGKLCATTIAANDTGLEGGPAYIYNPDGSKNKTLPISDYITCDLEGDRMFISHSYESGVNNNEYSLDSGVITDIPYFDAEGTIFAIPPDGAKFIYKMVPGLNPFVILDLKTGKETILADFAKESISDIEVSPLPIIPGK